jgi:hypothetical protein
MSPSTASSAAPATVRLPFPLEQVAIVAAAVPLGVAAAFRPELAVAAMLALVLLLVVRRPIVGLSAVVVLGFLESYPESSGSCP